MNSIAGKFNGIDRREWMEIGDWSGPEQCCKGFKVTQWMETCESSSYWVFSFPQPLFCRWISKTMCIDAIWNTKYDRTPNQNFHHSTLIFVTINCPVEIRMSSDRFRCAWSWSFSKWLIIKWEERKVWIYSLNHS